jgi:CHRD domain
MLKLLRLFAVLAAAAALALLVTPAANAQQSTTSVVPLSAECQEAEDSGATGFAFVSINEASGRITYHVVAFNLPGTITAAHPWTNQSRNGKGPVAVGLELTGANSGVVASGTATDPARADAIVADPASFYFNVHATTCSRGALRGHSANPRLPSAECMGDD